MAAPSAIQARFPALSLLAIAALLAACDDGPPKAAGGTGASATASTTIAAPTPPAPAKPKGMPELLVDNDGPYLAGTRINLADPQGPEKLAKIVKELPINGQQVTLTVEKKAKTPYVAAVVAALGDAGAPTVKIKTDGRDDLPKEITVTPEARVAALPACTVTVMVLKDLSTAVWAVRGGRAKQHRKGMAGPDLSNTGEQITKDLAGCDATMALFSGDESVPWENAFNLAGTTLKADEKKKLETLVLPREAPVAGRAVTIAKH
jgi:biopolymer transport protein ExbD